MRGTDGRSREPSGPLVAQFDRPGGTDGRSGDGAGLMGGTKDLAGDTDGDSGGTRGLLRGIARPLRGTAGRSGDADDRKGGETVCTVSVVSAASAYRVARLRRMPATLVRCIALLRIDACSSSSDLDVSSSTVTPSQASRGCHAGSSDTGGV